jgi:hypothetical protein
VTISKDQIVQFLESQGKHEQASQANSQPAGSGRHR